MPPPGDKFEGLLSDKDEVEAGGMDWGLGPEGSEGTPMQGPQGPQGPLGTVGGLIEPSDSYLDEIVRSQQAQTRDAMKASEKFGDLEFTAQVKNTLGPNMAGYYSPILDNPSKFAHVLGLSKKAHPDDILSLRNLFGGFYKRGSKPETIEQVIKGQLDKQDYYSSQQNPHVGSPLHAFSQKTLDMPVQQGHMYMNPKALAGSWRQGLLGEETGNPMDVWGHELGHSARKGQSSEGTTDEAIQRYEDSIYGLSPLMRDMARGTMGMNMSSFNAPLGWGTSMQQLQGTTPGTDLSYDWATPYGKKPTIEQVLDQYNLDNP